MWRLREALEKKGITRTQLSQLSGVAKGDITHYLKGDYTPKQDKCYLLAKALDVDPGWLMTGVEQVTDNTDETHIVIQSMEQFGHLLQYMTQEEYDFVVAAFDKASERMREKGIEP
jgi:transcriptional regulator with XRE-family HTH domain